MVYRGLLALLVSSLLFTVTLGAVGDGVITFFDNYLVGGNSDGTYMLGGVLNLGSYPPSSPPSAKTDFMSWTPNAAPTNNIAAFSCPMITNPDPNPPPEAPRVVSKCLNTIGQFGGYISFWMHGGQNGGQTFDVQLDNRDFTKLPTAPPMDGSEPAPTLMPPVKLRTITATAGQWTQVRIPVAPAGQDHWRQFEFQVAYGGSSFAEPVYFENIQFIPSNNGFQCGVQWCSNGAVCCTNNAGGRCSDNNGYCPNIDIFDPLVFDAQEYRSYNPDLPWSDTVNLANHWEYFGVREGRISRTAFHVEEYKAMYYWDRIGQMSNNFDIISYYVNAAYPISGEGGRYELHQAVFNWQVYLENYADLTAAFGPNNQWAAIQHWMYNGIDEGRQANYWFNVAQYKQQNPNLQGMTNHEVVVYYVKTTLHIQ